MRIPIVDEQDEIIGYKDRRDRNPKDICRVTGLWLTDPEGNILLAQRSLDNNHDPGKWAPAVSGTVEEGETYELNMIKETEEEIGLKNPHLVFGPKFRRSTSHEYFAQCFTAVVDHNYPFIKQDEEVEKIRWFTKNEIMKFLKEKRDGQPIFVNILFSIFI